MSLSIMLCGVAMDATISVGRCVIPCAFLVKVSNIHFLVEKCIL